MPVHATTTRPLQTLTLMPTSTRPKRKSVTAGLDDDSNGVNGGANGKEKENTPVEPLKKKTKKGKKTAEKEEDGGDKGEVKEKPPPKKKQKRTKPDILEDEGFIFRPRPRTRASLAANELILPTAPPPPVAVEPSKKKKPTTTSRKRAHDSPPPIEESGLKTRKKISLAEAEEEEAKEKKAPKKAAAKTKTAAKFKVPVAVAPVPMSPPLRIPPGGGSSTKMALPVSDTPIIRRNQQMRKGGQGGGNRRSSVGLRGRRASSLMDTGVLAEPHPSIAHEEYYKHIHDELLEPQRMKQLLAWCGRKALTPKDGKTGDANAAAVARIIEEEVLSDVLSNPGLSSWFNREDSQPSTVIKKPNPRNIDNLAKVEAIEASLKKLLAEKATWKSLLKTDVKATLSLAGGPDMNKLLQPSESAFASSSRSQDLLAEAKGLVKQHSGEIEFQVDQLADGIHKLNHYGKAADRLAGRILEDAEAALAVREARVRGEAGTGKLPLMEVLRSLARLDR